MARPKLEKDEKKERRVTFRLTDMEYEMIETHADNAEMTISEYIRHQLLKGKVDVYYSIVADVPELKKLTNEFARIGNNLNQIAKYFNTGGIRSLAMEDDIRFCINEIMDLRKQVIRMAGDFHGSAKTYRK